VEDNHYLQCLNWWAVQSCDTEMQHGFLYMLGPSFWELGKQTWLECGTHWCGEMTGKESVVRVPN